MVAFISTYFFLGSDKFWSQSRARYRVREISTSYRRSTSAYKTKHCCAHSCKRQCKEEKQSCYYINTSIGHNTIIFSSINPHYHTITSFRDKNMSTVILLFLHAKGRHKVIHNIDSLQTFT